jgi:hypothetical protein
MGMVSDRDRKLFEQLVQDCVLYGLNEQESLEYVEKRSGGIKMPRSTYYSLKKRISRQESNMLQHRLNEHVRVGFALNHFQHIHSIANIQKILFRAITDESSKQPNERNVFAISRLAGNMLENIQFLRQLNIDLPFVNQMKAELSKAKEYQRLAEHKGSSKWPDSSLVVDPMSFAGKDSEASQDDDDTPVFQ